jgi:rod shape-determining protein MreC
MRSKKGIVAILLLALFLYLSLYAWNARTGVLDDMASRSGLEFVGLVIKPGQWVADQSVALWKRYIYLLDLRRENDALRAHLDEMTLELAQTREQAAEVERLRRLLSFAPPQDWDGVGARVVAHRMGPNAVLDSVTIDKGTLGGAEVNTPVATPDGLVGRVLRSGLSVSTVLLITDRNSKVPVLGRTHRTSGVLTGLGPGRPLEVRYVPLNAPVDVGEILITSGLAQIHPKGLPVARVVAVERSDISLFLTVLAEPLVNLPDLEEVLLLMPEAAAAQTQGAGTAPPAPGPDAAAPEAQ